MTYEYVEQVAPQSNPFKPRAAKFKCIIDPVDTYAPGTVIAITFTQYCSSCERCEDKLGAPMLMRTITAASRQANPKLLAGDTKEYYCMTCLDTGRVAGIARRRWVLVEDA